MAGFAGLSIGIRAAPGLPARAGAAVTRARMSDDLDEPDPVILPVEDALDLHAFAPRDIPSVVEEYLAEAAGRGFPEVRLIHGRGKGVQRAIVQGLLARHPLVARFFDAPAERGGWGATVVVLKARESRRETGGG
jgi:dsDNA-specific endonuclease/ATPase MutS2